MSEYLVANAVYVCGDMDTIMDLYLELVYALYTCSCDCIVIKTLSADVMQPLGFRNYISLIDIVPACQTI